MKKVALVLLLLLALAGTSFAQMLHTESGALAVSAPTINNNPSVNNNPEAGALAVIQSYPNYMQPQAIYPYLLQIIPGVVGDVTDREEMPKFADIKPLDTKTDKVVKVISYTRGGRIAGFSRLEDFDSDLIDLIPTAIKKFGQKDTSKIRYKVLFKMSSKTIGANIGGGGATAGFGGGTNPVAYGTNGTGIGAWAVNTADPKFIIKFYLIDEYSGWKKVN